MIHLPVATRRIAVKAVAISLTVALSACAQLSGGPNKSSVNPAPLDAFMNQVERGIVILKAWLRLPLAFCFAKKAPKLAQ
jgi:predicted membrane protein